MLFYFYFRHIRRYAHDVPWIHLGIGLVGNFCFVVGSLFFLSPSLTRAGTWLFVVASWGLLIGVGGEILVRYETRQQQRDASATAARLPADPRPADLVPADPGPTVHGPTDTQPRPPIAREA